MNVAILTTEQKQLVAGQAHSEHGRFNPVQDADDNWVITATEQEQCSIEAFAWVKDLPLTEWSPKLKTHIW
jgi:hypothetical protein